ncbi:MAG: DUF924 family protein [Gemmobacter sp.]
MTIREAILDHWLRELGPEGWYAGGEALDADIRARFGGAWARARAGAFDHWLDGAEGCLAFLILTDQYPRNMWRGSGDSFATDAAALAAAKRAVAEGWDMGVPEPERQFFYLPYMHSEALADQEECIRLFTGRMPETGADNLLHAHAHAEVIRRFGRFPYRNDALGRETTAEEADFLSGGGYMSVVEELKAR